MSWLSGSRIKLAVRYGVAKCLESPLPALFLSDYVASLRQLGWPDAMVDKVQRKIKTELIELPTSTGVNPGHRPEHVHWPAAGDA